MGVKDQPTLFTLTEKSGEAYAHARRTDPVTSWEAAGSVQGIREAHRLVLLILRNYGALSDEAIARLWDIGVRNHYFPPISPSGLRTRRKELVDMGKIKDSGRFEVLPSGRRAIIWTLVEKS